MTIKRAPPHFLFTLDERKRVATVLTLLVAIAKQEKKSKNKSKRKVMYDYKDIGSWFHGPILCQFPVILSLSKDVEQALFFCATDLS